MDNVNLTTTPELSVGEIVSNAISIGMKQFFPLLLTGILYIITIWIPYLNIGTTIGLQCLVANLHKGQPINPTEIFDPKYRKNIGDFFILFILWLVGTVFGLYFFGAGLVIAYSWMLALPLFADKGTGPLESLQLSNKLTYGHKLTMFLGMLVVGIVIAIGLIIGMVVSRLISDILGYAIIFAVYVLAFPIQLGAQSFIYGRLTSGLNDNNYRDDADRMAMNTAV